MRIAVTGASGFCGGYVARLAAARGHEVRCYGRRAGPVGRHVLWDAAIDTPDFGGADAVIHLAAAVGDRGAARTYAAVNVEGGRRVLAAAAGRPVVWVSSASVYRPGPYRGAVGEGYPRDGWAGFYGRTKSRGEDFAFDFGAVVLRPRAVYGAGDPHLLPRLRRVVRGGRAWLPGPDGPISLTAVENLADACLAALAWPAGPYNIADEPMYRRDAAIEAVLGVPVRHVPMTVARGLAAVASLHPRPALTRYAIDQISDGLTLDTTRAHAQGWKPTHTLTDFVLSAGPSAGAGGP